MSEWEIREGDCVEVMASMDPDSVDAIVTDPPYGLGFMGKEWDRLDEGLPQPCTCDDPAWVIEYPDGPPSSSIRAQRWHEQWARAACRVLKPGGHLLAFGGTRTYHRLTCGIEDAGFEIRDCLGWFYGQGFPKSLNLEGGLGTALKPAHEPIVFARKPLAGTVAANVAEYGTGALNIDASRVGGRWPPNVLLGHGECCTADDCGPCCPVAEVDRQSGPAGGGILKPYKRASHDYYSGIRPDSFGGGYDDTGGASRFFPRFRYESKASGTERNRGLESLPVRVGGGLNSTVVGDSRSGRVTRQQNIHPTVKPIELMRWLVRLVTPPGGLVLDPFAGSGTTGIAATREGFRFVGIELAEYAPLARARISEDLPLFNRPRGG